VTGVPDAPEELQQAFETAALDARSCLDGWTGDDEGLLPTAVWESSSDSKQVRVVAWSGGSTLPASMVGCLKTKLAMVELGEKPPHASNGVLHLTASRYEDDSESRPQPTTLLGYELTVAAKVAGEELGSAKLIVQPGSVPAVRLRMTPVLAEPGKDVTVEIVRGPDFSGELPDEMWLSGTRGRLKAKVDKKKRAAVFTLPRDAQGWYEVTWRGARGIAYVRPPARLAVEVKPENEHYAPGQTARLLVRTKAGDRPTSAAVGLFGVDESLSQLTALPGPDDMARVQPKVSMASPAFNALDAQALALGRVRGAHAAEAVVLRVASLPPPAQEEGYVSGHADTRFDPVEELTDRFYVALAELHGQVRAWEETAPAEEKMQPATMAKLWKAALTACEKRGEKVDDAFGRPLQLSQLPSDLLALTDPRVVVIKGTRLPEDVESWPAWVAKEEP